MKLLIEIDTDRNVNYEQEIETLFNVDYVTDVKLVKVGE